MATHTGQSLTPYPWARRHKFTLTRRYLPKVVTVTTVLAGIAVILSPPSILFWLWGKIGYHRYNDSWSKRGLTSMILGVIMALIVGPNPAGIYPPIRNIIDGLKAGNSFSLNEFWGWCLHGSPWALVLVGIHLLCTSLLIERESERFLNPIRPTWMMKRRYKHNVKALTNGHAKRKTHDRIRFGVIVGDRLPWRQSRHGMVVELPTKNFGHGAIIGKSGMGKSTLIQTISYYIGSTGISLINIDFKGSAGSRQGLAKAARAAGVPFTSLDIGTGSKDTAWYDLLGGEGSPADKADKLIECFDLASGGGSDYYAGAARAWMPIQIEAAELFRERGWFKQGEWSLDFLWQTTNPAVFVERVKERFSVAGVEDREKFAQWQVEANKFKASDLQGLANEYRKIINAAGDRLKPNADHPEPLSMQKVIDGGGMMYIGIAASVNVVITRVLGTFMIKELKDIAAARQGVGGLNDVVIIPDEASQMGDRTDELIPLYQLGREAKMWIWPALQSFSVWPAETLGEITSNASTFVAMRIQDKPTSTTLVESMSPIYGKAEQAIEETKQRGLFGRQASGVSGDSRISIEHDDRLRAGPELSNTPVYHAYIWSQVLSFPGLTNEPWFGRRLREDSVADNPDRSKQPFTDAPLVQLIPYDFDGDVGFHEGTVDTRDASDATAPVEAEAIPLGATPKNQEPVTASAVPSPEVPVPDAAAGAGADDEFVSDGLDESVPVRGGGPEQAPAPKRFGAGFSAGVTGSGSSSQSGPWPEGRPDSESSGAVGESDSGQVESAGRSRRRRRSGSLRQLVAENSNTDAVSDDVSEDMHQVSEENTVAPEGNRSGAGSSASKGDGGRPSQGSNMEANGELDW